jgi:glycosyltransferase involved in cell wall biosynthesis
MVVHARYPIGEPRVEREARSLVSRGYSVDVICLRYEGESATAIEDNVRVYRLPVKRHRNSGVWVQFWEYLAFFALAFLKLSLLDRTRRYKTVQVHNLPDFLVFAALVPKLRGAKVVLDLHDLMPEFYAARFQRSLCSLPVRLIRLQEHWSCRFADHVITVTELWRRTLLDRGVPSRKVSVVMNVADSNIFNRNARRAPPRTSGEFRMIYHGNLTHRYGVDLAVRAVARIRKQIPNIHLLIHGGGPLLAALRRQAADLGLDGAVTFSTTQVPTPELPSLIDTADIGIVPYRPDVFTDGILPTKLMEYVAMGLPVIAARTACIASYFDEDMVTFFPPGDDEALADCIRKLYDDPARRALMVEQSQAFLCLHNWDTESAAYVALVDRLQTSSRGPIEVAEVGSA